MIIRPRQDIAWPLFPVGISIQIPKTVKSLAMVGVVATTTVSQRRMNARAYAYKTIL